MKILKLHFTVPQYVGSNAKSCDLTTHNFRIGGPGYMVQEKRSGKWFLVHGSNATAEVEIEEDNEPSASGAAARAAAGRGQAAKKPPPVPAG